MIHQSHFTDLWEEFSLIFSAPPVDGGYSEWETTSNCTVTCGNGTKTLTRTCTNPPPSDGGKDCSDLGSAEKTVPCNEQECRMWKSFIYAVFSLYLLRSPIFQVSFGVHLNGYEKWKTWIIMKEREDTNGILRKQIILEGLSHAVRLRIGCSKIFQTFYRFRLYLM